MSKAKLTLFAKDLWTKYILPIMKERYFYPINASYFNALTL